MATYFMLSSGSRTSFDAELKSSYLYMLRPGESEVRVHGTDASGKICQAKDRTTEPVIFVPVAGQKFKVLCSDVQLPEPPATTDARFQELPVVKPVGRSQRLIYEPYDWPSEWQSKVTNVRVIEAENGRPPSLMAHGGDQGMGGPQINTHGNAPLVRHRSLAWLRDL